MIDGGARHVSEGNSSDAGAGDIVTERQFDSGNLLATAEKHLIHFGEVVIFGCHPKNRHSVDAGLRQFFGPANRVQRFVNAVRRAAEESYLLPGDDGGRAIC